MFAARCVLPFKNPMKPGKSARAIAQNKQLAEPGGCA